MKVETVDAYMTRFPSPSAGRPSVRGSRADGKALHRHLPVVEGRKIVGMVSLDDLHLIETRPGRDRASVAVSEP